MQKSLPVVSIITTLSSWPSIAPFNHQNLAVSVGSDALVISEIQVAVDSSAKDEFVEIYNGINQKLI